MDLIKYEGVNNNTDKNIEEFRQFTTSLTVCIPYDRESINVITKVWVEAELKQSHIIKTPIGLSFEGQTLTGNKVLILGDLNVKLEYTSQNDSTSINTLNMGIPISSYVVVEEDFDDYLTAYPSFEVEDIYCKKLNDREFYLSISMLSIADIF